jgi:hypothetical protein
MGVNHGGTGGRIPQNLQWGTLIQVVPQIFVVFQNFKHSPWIRPHQISTQIYATGGELVVVKIYSQTQVVYPQLMHRKYCGIFRILQRGQSASPFSL